MVSMVLVVSRQSTRLTSAKKKPICPPWLPDLVRIARARQPATKVKRAWAAWKRAFDFWK